MASLRQRWKDIWQLSEKRSTRITIISVVLLLGIFAALIVPDIYQRVKKEVFGKRARQYIENNEYEKALLQLQGILQQFPNDKTAIELLVQLGEKIHAPWILRWKKRLYEIDPNDPANALGLAQQASAEGEDALAMSIASTLLTGPHAAAAHNILALGALRQNDRAKARMHFEAARKLKPESVAILKNYIAFLLGEDWATHRETVLQLIDELATTPSPGIGLLRFRVAAALKEKQFPEALKLEREIQKDPAREFADRLQLISLLAMLEPGQVDAELDQLAADPSVTGSQRLELLTFLGRNGDHKRLVDLFHRSSPAFQALPAVRAMEIESRLALGEHRALETQLKSEKWNAGEFLRLAYLAQLQQYFGETAEASLSRQASIKAAAPGELTLLWGLVRNKPEWAQDQEPLLGKMTEFPPLQEEALRELFGFYQKQRDALGLAQTANRLARLFPENDVYANNAVSLTLLTGGDAGWGVREAERLLEKRPDDPVIRATYAYSLLRQGENARALEIMEKLPNHETAEFALTYALALEANGRKDEARAVAQRIDRSNLLDLELKEVERLLATR